MQLWQDIKDSRTALFGFVSIGFGWACLSAQMPAIKEQIGASDAAYGTMALIGSIGAVAAMWLAPLAHRFIGRWSMLFGNVFMVLGFVTCGGAHDPVVFTLGLFFAAGGSGVADVLANAEVSEQEARTGRSLMNLNHGIFSAAYALCALAVGAARGAEWSPVAVFVAMGIAVALISPWLVLPDRRSPDDGDSGVAPRLGVIVWIGGIVVLAAFLGEAASEGWSALHIERTLGGSPVQGALGPAILGLSMAVGRLGGHVFFGHLPQLRVMGVALTTAIMGLALAGMAPNLPTVYVGLALGGLGVSVVGPLALGIVGQSVRPVQRLAAISRAAALGYGAFFVGPPLMGFVSEIWSLRIAFVSISVVLIVALALLPLMGRKAQPVAQRP